MDITTIPEHILDDIRHNVPFGYEGIYTDDELSRKTPGELFDHWLQWHGIIGYSESIVDAVEAIYGVDLSKMGGGNDEICPIFSTGCASARVVTICEGDNNCQHKGGK